MFCIAIFWRFVISNSHTHHYKLISLQASGTSGGTLLTRRVQSEHRLLRARVLLLHDRNFNVASEKGIRYPSYEVMYCREKMSLLLYGRAEAVRALTHAHAVCRPGRRCAGARALDASVPPRQLYSNHPTPAPPAQERQVSTWAGRWSRQNICRKVKKYMTRICHSKLLHLGYPCLIYGI